MNPSNEGAPMTTEPTDETNDQRTARVLRETAATLARNRHDLALHPRSSDNWLKVELVRRELHHIANRLDPLPEEADWCD